MLKRLFKDRFFNRKLVTLAMPITLQNLMVALVAAADAFILGKLNQDAMAAVSLATQVQFIQNCLVGHVKNFVMENVIFKKHPQDQRKDYLYL